MSEFKNIYNKLIEDGVIDGRNTGCTELEIEFLERKYRVTFPASYKDFLNLCCVSCEALDDNEFNYQYKYIECMTEQMLQDRRELIEEASEDENYDDLPENIFFIMDRYGDEFNYIIAKGGDSSEVYYHNYPRDSFEKVFDSIGEWFKAHAVDMKKFKDKNL